jgi:hypothetical protein
MCLKCIDLHEAGTRRRRARSGLLRDRRKLYDEVVLTILSGYPNQLVRDYMSCDMLR